MVGNFLYKVKAKKFSLGELEGDLFTNLSSLEYEEIERYFLEQYALKMHYSTPMGYLYSDNQTFNIDRKIEEDGIQKQEIGREFDTWGFYSGSTGWGWGLSQKSDMIDYHIASNLSCNINNHSNVGVNLYKIFNLFRQHELSGELSKNNIVYFGINEVYDLSNNQNMFNSMRDKRIEKLIVDFDKYYRNTPISLFYLMKQIARSMVLTILDIKNSFKKDFVGRLPKKVVTKVLNEKQYRENLIIIFKMVKEMDRLSSNTVFVLEPSLFDKDRLSEYEEKLLHKKRLSDNLLEGVFSRFYQELIDFCGEHNIRVIDARATVKGIEESLYFDYCHPYKKATKLIAEHIVKEIQG